MTSTLADAEDFICKTLAVPKDTQYDFAIINGGKAIGSVGVFRKDNIHRLTGEMGYYIAEPLSFTSTARHITTQFSMPL